MGGGAFPAEIALFYPFHRVIPGAASVRHHNAEQNACYRSSGKETAESFHSEEYTHKCGGNYRYNARQYHFLKRSFCGYVNTALSIRFSRAFHEAFYFPELTAYFLYKFISRSSDSFECHGRYGKRNKRSDKKSGYRNRFNEVYSCYAGCFLESNKKGKSCQSGRAYGETFADSRRSISEGIKFIGYLRTLLSSPAISDIPPALSAMGP
jgi:hypothetical protein